MKWKALFVGDIVMNQLPDNNFISADFLSVMNDHVIRSCNFEAPIRGRGYPIKKAGPHLNQHAQAPALVEVAGFNVISLANNHIYDYGEESLSDTLLAFKKAVCVGAGSDFSQAYALKQVTIQDVKVGFLSFCEAEFGALTLSSTHKAGYAWINHPAVNSIIIDARKSVDVLIIQCHAGVEQIDIPLPEWRERYKELVRLGADAIIGSHPHVPQGWEMYMNKPIFYSLGNYYFDTESDHPLWNKGIAVSLAFDNKTLSDIKVIGIERTKLGVKINQEKDFGLHLEYLNKALEEPGYSNQIQELAKSLWDQYYRSYYDLALQGIHTNVGLKQVITTFIKRLFFRKKTELNTSLLLHNIRIESHRWMVERALEEKNKI